ncbi:hypothetical protein ABZS29_19255 [Kribbella sp. NPDC005582]|uniref:hypothetical protein n=1 Tax=Kribbella sp. NPDC005582 TaxID=3156893 RepID=UPI0033B15241
MFTIIAFFVLVLAVGFDVASLFTGNGTLLWISLIFWPIGLGFAAAGWVVDRKRFRTPVGAHPAKVRELALVARREGNRKAAERLLQAAAGQGDVDSMWELAVLVMERDGVAAGDRWVRAAARKGHTLAQAFLDSQKNF